MSFRHVVITPIRKIILDSDFGPVINVPRIFSFQKELTTCLPKAGLFYLKDDDGEIELHLLLNLKPAMLVSLGSATYCEEHIFYRIYGDLYQGRVGRAYMIKLRDSVFYVTTLDHFL